MQVVSEKVGASIAAVPVVHAEERAGGPRQVGGLVLGARDVQDYRDAVLIIRANDALICVGTVS